MTRRKAYNKMMLRGVRGTMSRFLAILCIVVLGTGFLCGLLCTQPDMRAGIDRYFDEQNAMDFLIQGTQGINEDNVKALNADRNIEYAEGKYSLDMLVTDTSEESYVTRVIGQNFENEDSVNKVVLLDGRFPEAEGECVIEIPNKYAYEIALGEILTIDPSNKGYDDLMDSLKSDTFKVVGKVRSPQFIHMYGDSSTAGDGTMVLAMYVPEDSFDMEYYTAVYATAAGTKDLQLYTDPYDERIDEITPDLEALGKEQAAARTDQIRSDAMDEYNDGLKEFEEEKAKAYSELDDAAAELEDGRSKIADAHEKISDGWKEIEDAKEEVADGLRELADNRQKIEDGREQIAEGKKEIKVNEDKINDGLDQIASGRQQIADGREQIADGKAQIEENREKIADGREQTSEARQQIEEGRKQISEAREQLEEGRKQTSAAREQIEEGRKQTSAARQQIEEGQAQLEEARQQTSEGRSQLEAAKAQLEEQEKELSSRESQLEEAAPQIEELRKAQEMGMELTEEQAAMIAAYDEGVSQTAEARKQLEAAKDELASQETELDEADAALDAKEAEISGALAELDAKDAEMDKAEEELDAKDAEMDKAEEELDAREDEIDTGEEELESKEAEIDAAEDELDKGEKELKEKEDELNDADKDLDDKEKEAKAGLTEIKKAKKEIETKEAELNAGEKKLNEGEKKLNSAQREIQENEAKLRDSEAELETKEAELKDAEKEYKDAKAEAMEKIADGEKELADAKAEIDDIEDGKWIIRDRTDNMGMSSYKDDSAKIGAIAKIFPVFFFVIAALVALTTLTRLVEEERDKIGALKSLGYSNRDIRRYYMLYGLAASVLGCVIGIPAGCKFFPMVISNAYDMLYVLPEIDTPIIIKVAAPVSIGLTAMILLATWYSLREILKEKPAALLMPKAPKAGKRILLERIGFIWKHLSFSRKVTLRNIFRYKKRFLMTIVGVAGCFALLLTGFGVRDSIGNIVAIHYGELMHFDYSAQVEEYDALTENDDIKELISDPSLTEDWFASSQESVTLSFKNKKESSTIFVPEDPDKLEDFVTLRKRIGHDPVPFDSNSAVLTEKSAENLGVKVGDTLTIKTNDGVKAEVVLTGITENYVNSQLYIHPSYYSEIFDAVPDYTSIYLKTGPEGLEGVLAEKLLDTDDVVYVLDTQVVRDNFAKSVKSIDYIILVLIVASGALAIIVLYNLTNVNICERKKELATIRVLGFYHHEVSAYIFREVDILAIIGILVGIPVGIWLHHFIIITVEVAGVMFGRSINWPSYLIAAGFTIVFTLAVNLIMRRTIRKIDMVESMKAVD